MTEEILTRLRRIEAHLTQREPLDEWLTVKQAANVLKVSTRWIYDNAHNLPWLKRVNDRLWRVSRRGLQQWMEACP